MANRIVGLAAALVVLGALVCLGAMPRVATGDLAKVGFGSDCNCNWTSFPCCTTSDDADGGICLNHKCQHGGSGSGTVEETGPHCTGVTYCNEENGTRCSTNECPY